MFDSDGLEQTRGERGAEDFISAGSLDMCRAGKAESTVGGLGAGFIKKGESIVAVMYCNCRMATNGRQELLLLLFLKSGNGGGCVLIRDFIGGQEKCQREPPVTFVLC